MISMKKLSISVLCALINLGLISQPILIAAQEASQPGVVDSAPVPSISMQAQPGESMPDLSGEWEVKVFYTTGKVERIYKASLDRYGNGTYGAKEGEIKTTGLCEKGWSANWTRPASDEEGQMVLEFSPDMKEANGKWWPARKGDKNYEAKYVYYRFQWKRLTPVPENNPATAFNKEMPPVHLISSAELEAEMRNTEAALAATRAMPTEVEAPTALQPSVEAVKTADVAQSPMVGCPDLTVKLADVYDPVIVVNEALFNVCNWFARYFFRPVVEGFNSVAPEWFKKAVTNFYDNMRLLMSVPNAFLQLKFEKTRNQAVRLVVNSSIGILGMIDWAADFGFKKDKIEDFGLTLAHYGFPEGPILFLLQPVTFRDTVGRFVEAQINPMSPVTQYITDNLPFTILSTAGNESEINQKAHIQNRDDYKEVRDGMLIMRRTLAMQGS